MKLGIITSFFALSVLTGCGTAEVPQAHKARMFERTGALALYSGGNGLSGPILGPGTVYTGLYNEIRMVECAEKTEKEELEALTKDGVQFKLDVYTRYAANCDDAPAVEAILNKFTPGFTEKPEWKDTIYAVQLYSTLIRPALGEAVRESVSPYIANQINEKREELFKAIKDNFDKNTAPIPNVPKLVVVRALNLSKLDFPKALDDANAERAVQAIYKDKAQAEQEKVKVEIETTKMKKQLNEAEGTNEATRIDLIGAALRRNPEYLQYNMQQMMPGIYEHAGDKGNLILAAPTPNMVMPLPTKPAPASSASK